MLGWKGPSNYYKGIKSKELNYYILIGCYQVLSLRTLVSYEKTRPLAINPLLLNSILCLLHLILSLSC